MITAVIIDDEKHAVEAIAILLEQFDQNIRLAGFALSVEQGIELIEKEKPDLVFLDIELKDGLGFEVTEKTQHLSRRIIFTTAYDQYAIRAFKVRALDYLLKPFNLQEFRETVERYIAEFKTSGHVTPSDQAQYDTLIKIPESLGYNLMAVEEIIFLQADSNYTRLISRGGKTHVVAKTLKEFETRLNPAHFARVHNSYIINRAELRQLLKGTSCQIKMSNGSIIPVSRARKKNLMH